MADEATSGAKPGSDATSEQDGQEPKPGATPDAGTDNLGEAGKLALEKERKRAEAAEKELKKLQDAQLTEQERTQKELERLKSAEAGWQRERQEMRLEMTVTETARNLGYANPQLASRLLDRSAVAYAEDGTPQNVKQLLTALLESEPYLKGGPAPATSQSWGAGATGSPSRHDDMNQRIREAAGRG